MKTLRYRLRFDNNQILTVKADRLLAFANDSNYAFEDVLPFCEVRLFDCIKTFITKVDSVFLQYSMASQNSGVLASLMCFTDQASSYANLDDKSLFHSEEELNEVFNELRAGKSLSYIKIYDYLNNSDTIVDLEYSIGKTYDKGVCAGYVILKKLHNQIITPVFVTENKWNEFLAFTEFSEDVAPMLVHLLSRR